MVADYRTEFFKLGNQCKGVPEETLVGLCMVGLRPEIAAVVRVFEPDSLRAVFRLAGNKEEELASWRGVIGRYQKPSGGGSGSGPSSSPGVPALGPSTGGGVTTGPTTTTIRAGPRAPPKGFTRLSPAEIEQKRREGKCFSCDERFTFGHKCGKPKLMFLVGRWEDEAEDEVTEDSGAGREKPQP
ncbi:unnamed protein product [Linum trigynum]|uniref:Retrotransposon gag domain-containing protein n=1 Tax=Linum trigynum TaxID=586398 RepID=A0AAV2GST7_9ROSI